MELETQPRIIIDTREQDPLRFVNLESVEGSLYTGDYSIQGLEDEFCVERKSIPDLVACCKNGSGQQNRARFEREMSRMCGYRFARLVVIGSIEEIRQHRYRSRIKPKSVINSLHAFNVRYGNIAPQFIAHREKAAEAIENWARWYIHDLERKIQKLRSATAK